jgi:hypothetical protein
MIKTMVAHGEVCRKIGCKTTMLDFSLNNGMQEHRWGCCWFALNPLLADKRKRTNLAK